ncbi:hypothetical protein SAMN04488067_10965 [Halorubrum xinjiangense]|uniref:Uncharacterized protein n=1 Tax=Halorubrum xinjiangense TaxID=261291 RepID=A0A1G7P7S3_9EURY|nr:hypothetical protein [Halorubrum xinjiangense]SDF82197.1 hypothetical protein SAMN04488067_10965 [Halorubrum xinjiangense]
MIDEPLPAAERDGIGSNSADEPPDRDASSRDAPSYDAPSRDAIDPSRERATPERDPREEPDRATDPPPDRPDRDAACECGREPVSEGDEASEPDGREYRLERLRLWRTVVTLAVVVARLIRTL